MLRALKVIGRALALWWQEPFFWILLNIGWLVMQIPIITGPAATAVMLVNDPRTTERDYLSVQNAISDARRLFIPALKWGVVNAIILAAVIGNFWAYRSFEGAIWIVLRGLWGAIGVMWIAVNLFYWPFWLEQERPTMRDSLFNGLLLIAKHPGYSVTLLIALLLITAISLITTLPFGAALMAWIALIGMVAVDEELKSVRAAEAQRMGQNVEEVS